MNNFIATPRSWIALCGAATLLLSAAAFADPPDRVARLTQIDGTVTFSPAGEDEWAPAEPNRPLTTGDRVWADAGSHAELQIGTAAARLGENTSVEILNLDDRIGQFQLAQGTLNLRVRLVQGDQFYEIDTPTLAFSVRRDGDYRVDVDPSGNTTVIQVRNGEGDAWGEGTAYTIDAGQQYAFTQGFQNVQYEPLPPPDAFDRWCFDRNRFEDQAMAGRYVSPDVIGYSDLDQYGTWRSVQDYGTVWVPTRVDPDWAPYHYGRWAWIDPWGWTWIDDQPWGFAPFHYGRWAYLQSRWCWVPGPVRVRAVYAPALVAFVGGGGFSISIGGGPVTGVAWFPLGVGDVYRPPYGVSETYFTNVNVTNTVINRTYVTNVYNNPNAEVRYRNRQIANAVTAVPTNVFAGGERVERHAVRVNRDIVARQPVTPVAAIAPTRAAVIATGAAAAGAAAAAHRPPRQVLDRQVVARTQPPPPKPSFEATSHLLASQPGRPLAAQEMQRLRNERASNQRGAQAPRVKVVSPNVTPRGPERANAKGGPTATPPAAKGGPGAPTAQEQRARERRPGQQAGQVPQPPAAAQERMRESERRSAQGAPAPPAARGGPAVQEERAAKERRAAPNERVPQPPAAAQERMRAAPPQAGEAAQRERAQQQRAQQEQAQQQRAEQQRAQQERTQQQRAEQQKAQQERTQQQRAEQQKAQQERAQQQRAEQQRAQQQRAEQQKAQQERAQQQRAEQQRVQQQRAEQQKAQQERAQQQRAEQQKAQQERAQQQRAEQQKAQQQRAEQQRAEQQKAQQQRAEQQKAQQERAQQQRAEQQRAEQQGAQQQRARQEATQQRAEQQRAQEKEKEKERQGGQ